MATLSTCPRCSQLITLPEGYGEGAPMRCPLCRAEYPLGEALALVPPELIPVVELAGSEAVPPPDAATDFLAGLARLEESYAAAPATGDDTAAEETPHSEDGPFGPIFTGPPPESDAMSVANRHKRKSKSALRMILEIVISGMVGLLIGYYTIFWIQRDSCKLPRIRWLPFLPPAHSTDTGVDQ